MAKKQTTDLLRVLLVVLMAASAAGHSFSWFSDGLACFGLSGQDEDAAKASSKCKNGYSLAWFDSRDQMQQLAKVLTKQKSFVGVTKQSGGYVWSQSGQPVGSDMWKGGVWVSAHSCAVLRQSLLLLEPEDCDEDRYFLCRKDTSGGSCGTGNSVTSFSWSSDTTTSAAVTTVENTTPSQTTPHVTTTVTTQTTPDVTTAAQTTPDVTTAAQTTPGVTTAAQTTPDVTTAAQTTPGVTTAAQTTPDVTTAAQTTPDVTTAASQDSSAAPSPADPHSQPSPTSAQSSDTSSPDASSQSASPQTSPPASVSQGPTTTSATAAAAKPGTPPKPCSCHCLNVKPSTVAINHTQVSEMVDQIRTQLTVERSNLSSTIRRKTSAPDGRTSAKVTGSFGVALLVLVGATLVLLDLDHVIEALKSRRHSTGRDVSPEEGEDALVNEDDRF